LEKQRTSTQLHFNDRVRQIIVEFAELVRITHSQTTYVDVDCIYQHLFQACVLIYGSEAWMLRRQTS